MDNLVYTTAVSRLVLICGVFLINTFSLIRLLLCGVKQRGRKRHCVHTVTTGVILLCCIVYLCSWLPSLGYSLYNGEWPLLSARDHCVLQYSLTSQVTTILLAVQTIRKLFDAFTAPRATILSYAAVIAWIIPQLLYLALTEVLSSEQNLFQFLDRLVLIPNSLSPSSSSVSNVTSLPAALSSVNAANTVSNKYTIGFMICIHQLASPVVTQLFWHYLVLVLPLTLMIFISFAVEACKTAHNKLLKSECKCQHDLLIALSLYFNLMWLLLLWPIIVLQSLYMNKSSYHGPPYLDFGAHLVLIFASIFVPFSRHGGFRSHNSFASSSSPTLSTSANSTRYMLPPTSAAACAALHAKKRTPLTFKR